MQTPSDDVPPLLRMTGISKSFPGVKALENVDFAVGTGEIHAFLGENGAGKSTLLNALVGQAQGASLRLEQLPARGVSASVAGAAPLEVRPRDVEPNVNQLDNVYLYDIDDLGREVEQNRKARQMEALALREQGLSYRMIGDRLGVSRDSAAGLVRRARQKATTAA